MSESEKTEKYVTLITNTDTVSEKGFSAIIDGKPCEYSFYASGETPEESQEQAEKIKKEAYFPGRIIVKQTVPASALKDVRSYKYESSERIITVHRPTEPFGKPRCPLFEKK